MTMTPQREKIAARQRELRAAGFYDGAIDGIAGRLTKQAEREYQQMLEDAHQPISINNPRPYHKQIAWGKKVTQLFKEKVLWIVDDLKWPEQAADWIMACMAFESGEYSQWCWQWSCRADPIYAEYSKRIRCGRTNTCQNVPRSTIILRSQILQAVQRAN